MTCMTATPEPPAARTDRGRVRDHNEDSYLLQWPVALVADGLGGHPGGEDASRVAVEVAGDVLASEPPSTETLVTAWEAAHRAVAEEGAASGRVGMATTLVGGVLSPDGSTLYLANVGDSRAYHLTGAGLRQLTVDDNEAQELVRYGVLTREQARVHPARFWLSQSVGRGDVQVRTQAVPVAGGRLLLCSDGLLELDDVRVEALLRAAPDPRAAVDALVETVLAETPAADNITVLVADLPAR